MSDNRAKVWFALFVLVIFCAGTAAGVVVGRRMGPPPPRGFGLFGPGPDGPGGRGRGLLGRGDPGLPPPLPPNIISRLTRDLQLDESQQVQLGRILDERRDRLEQVHRDARDRFDKEQRELHDAIRGILRPDQQQTFDRIRGGRP
jgi:hypothetical protein